MIEKHFTLDKTIPGNDHYHAMNPEDARGILDGIAFLEQIRGSYEIKPLDSEKNARRNARRSLISAGEIKKGAIVEEGMLTYKRPGTGISPEELGKLVGRRAKEDIPEDTILQWGMFAM